MTFKILNRWKIAMTVKIPHQFDSQFFILRVIASVYIINQLITKL
jgi:hypothetical protein